MFEVLGFYKFVKIRSLKKNKVLLQDSRTVRSTPSCRHPGRLLRQDPVSALPPDPCNAARKSRCVGHVQRRERTRNP